MNLGTSRELRVLVTGGSGFVGTILCDRLSQSSEDICVFSTGAATDARSNYAARSLDVVDQDAVMEFVENFSPDIVVHLAAMASVRDSIREPLKAWSVNLMGTLNIVLAMQRYVPSAHLLYVSSADVYGSSLNSEVPVDEGSLLQPLSPYASSKAAADILVRQVASSGLSSTIVRPFSHTGPGQSETFVIPSFAAQIARIEAGLSEPVIKVGNIDEIRDFLDVGDVVDAYLVLLSNRSSRSGGEVFNVSSGVPKRIGDILDVMLRASTCPVKVKVDKSLLRPSAVPIMVGNSHKLYEACGWTPKILIEQTALELLRYYRKLVQEDAEVSRPEIS